MKFLSFSHLLIFLVLSYSFGCAGLKYKIGKPFYPSNLTLSSEIILSPDKTFSAQHPEGWFTTLDDSCYCDEIWFVKENYSGVVKISLAQSDVYLYKLPIEERLLTIAELSLGIKQRKFKESFSIQRKPELFTSTDDLLYADYEFSFGKNQSARVIILELDNKIFEVFAYQTDYTASPKILPIELFSAQQSIIATLK
ncbi:MAG: hypothetical protein N3A61_08870 [Ignavibacteria bacterium]|nr:hypothetical protein [Ignavibacteria bacterium]